MVKIQLGGHKRGSRVRGHASVDDIDADLATLSWRLLGEQASDRYAVKHKPYSKGETILMHRVVVSRMLGRMPVKGEVTDHINGDGLDNRRSNLRCVTVSGNMQNRRGPAADNTSGHRGVTWDKKAGKWNACVNHAGRMYRGGSFTNVEDAAAAAQRKRDELGFLKGAQ